MCEPHEDVWLADWAGYHRTTGYGEQKLAVWRHKTKVVIFGGLFWGHVPDMPAAPPPTEGEVAAWAAQYPLPELDDGR